MGEKEKVVILDRYEIYPDGTIYDTEKGEDIPQWIFEFRDFVKEYTIDEIRKKLPVENMDDINKGGGQYGHPETDFNVGFNSYRKEVLGILEGMFGD